jgi:hypothetical protein
MTAALEGGEYFGHVIVSKLKRMDDAHFFIVLPEVRGSRFLRKGWLSSTKLINAMAQNKTTPILTNNYT